MRGIMRGFVRGYLHIMRGINPNPLMPQLLCTKATRKNMRGMSRKMPKHIMLRAR